MYVARNLANLPPLSLDGFDILSVVQDISTLKSELNILKEHRQTSAKLLHELQHLRTSRHGIASGVSTSGATESNTYEISNLSVHDENVHDDENKLIGGQTGHNVIDGESDENDNEDGQDCVVGDVGVRGDNKERDKFCVEQTERITSAAPRVESSGSPNGTSGSTEHVTYATAARAADTDTDGFTRVVYNSRHKQGGCPQWCPPAKSCARDSGNNSCNAK